MEENIGDNVFVPSSGDLFLIRAVLDELYERGRKVFVPSSGDLFLMKQRATWKQITLARFRPLFWGFVFNELCHCAIGFFFAAGFRPLFWGFVFNFAD